MKRLAKIKNLIENFENQPICFENWLVIFIAIISVRLLEEIFLNLNKIESGIFITNNFIWHDFVHIFLIFAFVNLVSFFVFKKSINLKLSAFLNISLLSTLFLSIIPPFLDFLISKKHNLINFYEFYSPRETLLNFFTFMQQDPFIGTTPGQRIGILISIILVGFYTFLKTQKFWLSLLNTFLFYVIFFFVSTLPSLITFLVKGFHFQSHDVASLFFAPTDLLNQTAISVDISLHKKMILSYFVLLFFTFLFISLKNKLFQALLKNIRLTQTFYHLGLLSIGFAISIIFNQTILIFNFFNFLSLFLIALVTILMWFSSVIINDYFDEEIDKITNQQRPLITKIIDKKTYLKIGIVTFFIALLITFFINISLTIWFSFYYTLTLIYNVPPLRLKRFLGLATFLSALASVIIIFIGYLSITPENSLQNFPSSLIYLFLITFTISLPLKDFKDIEGDRENKVFTLPVIFGEKNGRLILGINFFISYFLSVYFLQEKKLFFPALVFGIINFLTINLKFKENYLFSQKKITPIIFSLVFFYGIILVYTIFKNNLIEFFKF